jgi:hypothetical protein
MSKLSQFLQKAGLVEPEDQPFDPANLSVPPADPPSPVSDLASREVPGLGRAKFSIDGGDGSPLPATSDGAATEPAAYELREGVAFDEIYRDANVPSAPFPIERLQKLIDGLRQLDPVTQKAAVLAMDAADEGWTIEDVLTDAQRKTDALHAYNDQTAGRLAAIEKGVERDVASMTDAKDTAIADLRTRISDLQQQLEAATSQHASDISALAARKTAAQQAAERERQRVTESINRINNLIHPFLSSTPNH